MFTNSGSNFSPVTVSLFRGRGSRAPMIDQNYSRNQCNDGNDEKKRRFDLNQENIIIYLFIQLFKKEQSEIRKKCVPFQKLR